MLVDRRKMLTGGAAMPLWACGMLPSFAQMAIGDATISTLSDGSLVLPGDFIFAPMPQEELSDVLAEYNVARDRLTPECNLTLFQTGEANVLFDVGSGPDFTPSAGKIVDSLDALGLAPEDITHVVFTHAHPDHIWGLLDDFDDPLFYEAEYLMGRVEWDYWWNPETVNEIGEARAAFAVGAKRRMEVIEDSVTLFDGDQEILPGVYSIESFGHTPGHMSFEIRQGTESIMVLGDAIGNHHVAFARPEWLSGSDQDSMRAAETRKRLFDRIIADKMRIVGFHLPSGGMGHVERKAAAYQFVAEV